MRALLAFLTWDLSLPAMALAMRPRRGRRLRDRLARHWRDVIGLGAPVGAA